MIKRIALALIALIILVSFTTTNNFRDLVQERLAFYMNNYPEKVYIQTDKPHYSLGEDIWYNAYLVNGATHMRTRKSKVVYVELINQNDSIISKQQLYTSNINVAGDFKIDKDWKPGNYMLRAYTNYMRNSGTDYFFKKQIPIFDLTNSDNISSEITSSDLEQPNANKNKTETYTQEKPDITFYPEGGYLVNGLLSKVGIKAKDKFNNGITLNGIIKDFDNTTICTFETLKFGLGTLALIPEKHKTYHATVKINGIEYTYDLPKALPNGYNLNIINNGDDLIIKIKTNNPYGLLNSYLLAHQRGVLVYEKLETEKIDTRVIKLNTKTLSDGVTHFTLFNGEGKPVCERLAYIDNPDDNITLDLISRNPTPGTRDHVSFNIGLKDKDGNPVSGNLSMSVTDVYATGNSAQSENIKTYLLLNSDLRGHIKNPGYFFEKENDPERRYLLDLLMQTHGWRRFTWNELLYENINTVNNYNPETGIFISGRTTTKQRSPVQTFTQLTFLSDIPYQERKTSESNGTFKYGPYVFMDTLTTILEAKMNTIQKDKRKNKQFVQILLDRNQLPSPQITRDSISAPNNDDFLKYAQNMHEFDEESLKDTRLLDEIVVTAKVKSEQEKRDEELSERAIYGFPTYRIDMKDYKDMEDFNVTEILAMLPRVEATSDSIAIRGADAPPMFFLGDTPVQYEEITGLIGADIEFIDILIDSDALYFSETGNSAIVIHLKEGVDFLSKRIARKSGIINFKAFGFYSAREFYAPDHMDPFETFNSKDIRTTLHWAPKIVLNSEKQLANVSFYTSDARSTYAIRVEGITDTGVPVFHLSTFTVE